MRLQLLKSFKKYFLSFLLMPLLIAWAPTLSSAQSAGDIAFTGFNGDGNDDFAIVALEDIPINTEIHFTDRDWNGSAFISPGDAFSWDSGSSIITAGTVITFNDISTAGRTVSEGSYSGGSAITLTVSTTVIYAYTGTDVDTPSTFLAAIATNSDNYDGTDGTLSGTGLNEGTTAILLSSNVDGAAYVGDRSGNTPNGYRTELNDIASNWDETGATGDGTMFLPFDDTAFTIISPPTVAFTAGTLSVAENGTSINLTVELIEASGTAVDVDVVFLSGSSTATNGDDFDDGLNSNYMTQTVSFGSGAASGATQTVAITLTDDSNFEGTEKAVFQLQNNTSGSIISPEVLTLTINDDDAPDVVINEILYDPAGDADGNGSTSTSDDEFIEFVNNESFDIDISGWTVYDDATLDLRHTFPSGTVIPANGALVLFADDNVSPVGGFGGAVIQSSNESTTLSLNNGGDTITLQDASGNTVVSETYDGSESEESITRDPDITGSFTGHSSATGSSSDFSPGTKIDGTAFGGGYAIGIRGGEGWRMISSPTQSTSFNDLFADLWTQGAMGSDDDTGADTQYSWDETAGGSFDEVTNMGNTMTPGKGYIVYVFEDDEFSTPGVQGGFPKTISTSNTENSSPFSIPITATDNDDSDNLTGNEGWNLLGNPYGTDIKVDEILSAVRSAVQGRNAGYEINTNVYIWDHSQDGYVDLAEGSDETVAPFQGFFVRVDTVENNTSFSVDVDFKRSDLAANEGTDFYKQKNRTAFKFNISLSDNNSSTDKFFVEFGDNGAVGYNNSDAYKLFSLNPNAINLYSLSDRNKLLKDVLPDNLNEIVQIPLAFDAPNRNELTFRWEGLETLPPNWEVTLIDRDLNREIPLTKGSEYRFAVRNQTQNKQTGDRLYKTTSTETGNTRFALSVNPGTFTNSANEKLPSSVKLNPNYPNPFNPSTTISFSLTQETQVKMTIWNIVGQKVATLVDNVVEAGTHTQIWNANDMPSGIYIAQMEVGNNVFIRKMTLIK